MEGVTETANLEATRKRAPNITVDDARSLREALLRYGDVPPAEFDNLLRILRVDFVDRCEYLVRAGENRSSLDFIVSGVIRCLGIEESGFEYTKHFFTDCDFVVADRSFLYDDPSSVEEAEYFFQAIEDTRILTVAREEFESHLVHPCWRRVFMTGIARLQKLEERRIGQLLSADAEARYRLFLEEYPGLENRIRQHHIASYLGISPVSLSRIRGKLASD